jgi:hypothetical protein
MRDDAQKIRLEYRNPPGKETRLINRLGTAVRIAAAISVV